MNMDFNVKKIVKDAGAALSRVVQVNAYFPNYFCLEDYTFLQCF